MMPHLIGLDPSTMLYKGLSAAIPEIMFGWDMPEGDGPKCLMVLDPGRYPTPVTQSMTLRLTVVDRHADGSGDWAAACVLTRRIHRWLLRHATDYPCAPWRSSPDRCARTTTGWAARPRTARSC